MKLPELEQSVREGRLVPDKKICLNESGELAVTKFAVEPVWYLPGVAERFGIGEHSFKQQRSHPVINAFLKHGVGSNSTTDEGALRRSLFENTGGSFPELITRADIKLFLPRTYFRISLPVPGLNTRVAHLQALYSVNKFMALSTSPYRQH